MSPNKTRRRAGNAPRTLPPEVAALDLFDEEGVRGMVMCADQATRPATEAESLAGQLPGRRGRGAGPDTEEE